MLLDGNEIGGRLKKLRDNKGLSMEELLSIIGIKNTSSISRWENNQAIPRPKIIKRYAEYFGVSEDWIRYGDLMSFTESILDNETFHSAYDEKDLTPLQKAIYDFNYSKYLLDEDDYTELEKNYYYVDEDEEADGYEDGERVVYDDPIENIDMGMLTYDLSNFILYGFANEKTTHIDSEYIYADEYEKVIKSIGYDKENILQETIRLFKTNLRDLEDIREHIFQEEDLQEELKEFGLENDEHIKKYILGDKPQIIQKYSNYPNITNLINKLEKIRDKDKKDISQGIYEAINKLLD